MKITKFFLALSLLFLLGCPESDDFDKNFFAERYTYVEHYFSTNPERVAQLGDQIIFQLERKNQEHQFSYDYSSEIGELNELITQNPNPIDLVGNFDTYDPNQDLIIENSERGIDQIPVQINKSSLPDVSISYRFETLNSFIFRLKDQSGNVIFTLDETNTDFQLNIGSNSNFTAGRYIYELESSYTAEDIVSNILRNDFRRGDTIMYVHPVIIQTDRERLGGAERQTLDQEMIDENGELVDRDLFLEDTFILISDSRCIDCDLNSPPLGQSFIDRVIDGIEETIELPSASQNACLNDIDFRGADFSFSDFSNSTFIRSEFGTPEDGSINPLPSNFNNAKFENCNFAEARFISDTLSESNSGIDIDMTLTSFFSSDMVGVEIVGCYGLFANFEACSFGPNAIFTKNYFRESNLIGMEARNSNFSDNFFRQSDVGKTKFDSSDVSRTDFSRCDLVDSDFLGAVAFGTNFCNTFRINTEVAGMLTDETTQCDPTIPTE